MTTDLTIGEIGQAFVWGFLGIIPLLCMIIASDQTKMQKIGFYFLLSFVFQITFGVACFKAGIHF